MPDDPGSKGRVEKGGLVWRGHHRDIMARVVQRATAEMGASAQAEG
jgi:hypothetical protein